MLRNVIRNNLTSLCRGVSNVTHRHRAASYSTVLSVILQCVYTVCMGVRVDAVLDCNLNNPVLHLTVYVRFSIRHFCSLKPFSFHPSPGRHVHCDTNSAYLGSIQTRRNYYANTSTGENIKVDTRTEAHYLLSTQPGTR